MLIEFSLHENAQIPKTTTLTKQWRNTFPPNKPVICLVWNSFSGWKLNNSKPQFHLHCQWSARKPGRETRDPRRQGKIRFFSIQGGPLIVINGVLTPYKWPDINKWRWLGWFHPWVFGPTLPWWLPLRYTRWLKLTTNITYLKSLKKLLEKPWCTQCPQPNNMDTQTCPTFCKETHLPFTRHSYTLSDPITPPKISMKPKQIHSLKLT